MEENKQLKPLRFLEGTWHGDGLGPYGPYEFETQVEERGRWLLLTSTVFETGTDNVFYVSTQVFGYDDAGLTLDFFDTAGSFDFHSVHADKGLLFEWKNDQDWKRSALIPQENGRIKFKYESMEPAASDELSVFEGEWIRGTRSREH